MKHKFFLVLMIFGLFSVVFFSCRKEIYNLVNGQSTVIYDARSWYEANQSHAVSIKSAAVKGGNLYAKPDWNHAYSCDHKKFTIVEIPISTQGRFGFVSDECKDAYVKTGDDRYMNSLTFMVVQTEKESNIKIGFLMTIIPDKAFRDSTGFKSFASQYMKLQKNFSGVVLYHELNGNFANGWQFSHGKAVRTLVPDNGEGIGVQMKSTTTTCYTTTITGYYQDCVNYYTAFENADGSYSITGYSGTACGSAYSQVIASYQSCSASDTGNTNGGGGYVSGVTGSAPYVSKGGDIFCKAGMARTMSVQSRTTCVQAIMAYIMQQFCEVHITVQQFIDFYNSLYTPKCDVDGTPTTNTEGFVSRYFNIASFPGYKAAIDNGDIVMVDIPTSTPYVMHEIAVIGYHLDGSLIYMDPARGYLMEVAPSSFNPRTAICITGAKN